MKHPGCGWEPLRRSDDTSHLAFRISYCTADKMHDKVFAYIAQSQHNENLECHAFLCTKRKMVSGERLGHGQAVGSLPLGALSGGAGRTQRQPNLKKSIKSTAVRWVTCQSGLPCRAGQPAYGQ